MRMRHKNPDRSPLCNSEQPLQIREGMQSSAGSYHPKDVATSRTLKPTQELSRQTLLSQADAGCLDFEQYTAGFSM